MPGTRSRGAGKTTAGVAADGSGGNFPAGQPGDESAERELTSQQENMENSTLKDLMDAEILRLRASDTASRKKLDDICGEVADQVKVVTAAKAKPKAVLVQYTKGWRDMVPRDNVPRDNLPRDNVPQDNPPRRQCAPETICPETIRPGDNMPRRHYAPETICPGDKTPRR